MMKKYVFLILGLSFFIACTPSKEKRVETITNYENQITTNQSVNPEQADSLISMFEGFIKDFPNDTLVPVYIFKIAQLTMNVHNNHIKAIALLDKIIEQYPNYNELPTCYYLKGYFYDLTGNNVEKARTAYTEFLRHYPTHPWAENVTSLLQIVEKDPIELVKEFEKNIDTTSLKTEGLK